MQSISELLTAYRNGEALSIGILGNSIGCGYRGLNWEQIVLDLTPGIEGRMTDASQNNVNILGWTQQFQVWLQASNPGSVVWNRSGSGWTTQNHIDRLTVANLASLSPKPTAILIPLQVNDRYKDSVSLSPGVGQGMTWDAYLANTRALIRQCIANDMLPILMKENNEPLPADAGWKWGEYPQPHSGTQDDTHRAFGDYVDALDVIAVDAEWEAAGVGPLTIVDGYTPTLNTGQEPQYRYKDYNGNPDLSADGLAPADYRYSLMIGWYDENVGNDVIHLNTDGHGILLNSVQSLFSSSQTEASVIVDGVEFLGAVLPDPGTGNRNAPGVIVDGVYHPLILTGTGPRVIIDGVDVGGLVLV